MGIVTPAKSWRDTGPRYWTDADPWLYGGPSWASRGNRRMQYAPTVTALREQSALKALGRVVSPFSGLCSFSPVASAPGKPRTKLPYLYQLRDSLLSRGTSKSTPCVFTHA